MSVSSSSVAIWHAAGIAGKALGCGMQLGSSNLPQLASQLLPKVGNVIVADRFQGPRRQMGSSRVAACPSHYAEHAGESACLSSPSKHEQNYGNVSSSNVNRDMQHPTCEVPGQAASHPVPSVALGSVAGKLTAVRDLQLRYIHSGTAAAANRHWLPFSTGTHLCHISRTSLPADSASASSPRLSPCRGQQTIQHHFSRNLPGSAASNQSSLNAAWYHPLFNAANAVSMARLASGPFIAAWLLEGHTQFAVVALALSGVSTARPYMVLGM